MTHPAPCPFCAGSRNALPVVDLYQAGYQVTCLNCLARGPAKRTRVEAVQAWRRAAPRTPYKEPLDNSPVKGYENTTTHGKDSRMKNVFRQSLGTPGHYSYSMIPENGHAIALVYTEEARAAFERGLPRDTTLWDAARQRMDQGPIGDMGKPFPTASQEDR